MRRYVILQFILCMSAATMPAQTLKEVFNKMNATLMAPKPVHFNTTYNLYRDAKAKSVHESYVGQFQKNSANEIYMKIDNTEFINSKKRTLKVNHDQRAILIMDPQTFTTGDFDMKKLAEVCKVKSFTDLKSHWEIILVPNAFSGLNYSSIQVLVNKDYTIKKQVFFYNTGIDFSKDYRKQDICHPRLEILYSNYNQKIPDIIKLGKDYFITFNKANKAVSSAKYRNYEIIDRRTVR
jgi:hypothetical protein